VPPATTPLIALKYEAAPLPFVVSGAPGQQPPSKAALHRPQQSRSLYACSVMRPQRILLYPNLSLAHVCWWHKM